MRKKADTRSDKETNFIGSSVLYNGKIKEDREICKFKTRYGKWVPWIWDLYCNNLRNESELL